MKTKIEIAVKETNLIKVAKIKNQLQQLADLDADILDKLIKIKKSKNGLTFFKENWVMIESMVMQFEQVGVFASSIRQPKKRNKTVFNFKRSFDYKRMIDKVWQSRNKVQKDMLSLVAPTAIRKKLNKIKEIEAG